MPVITALRATRRGRVAVHVDGSFFCSVSDATIARARLFKGRELDETELDALRSQASDEHLLGDAYRLLAQRQRSRAELRDRLLRKGHGEEAVAAALERLAGDGLLDDAAFARAFVADKRRLQNWGEQRIRRGLTQLGVARADAEAAIGEGDEGAELARALALLTRSGPPRPPLEAARRRAYGALQRKGFSGSVAYQAIARWSGAAGPDD